VEEHLDHNAFIERLIEMQQTAVRGELVQFRADAPPVLQLYQREHHTA
jgi:hypothetical protein